MARPDTNSASESSSSQELLTKASEKDLETAPRDSRVRIEVFTNRWYSQPEIALRPDGSFSEAIYLGGQGNEQCHHMIRARLYDEQGDAPATDLVYNVVRANPDGRAPRCSN